MKKEPSLRKISVRDFNSKVLNTEKTDRIKIEIISKYKLLKESAKKDDDISDTLVNRMVKMHLNISE
jgi:hypothetical protein